jgi:HSP20 family protein
MNTFLVRRNFAPVSNAFTVNKMIDRMARDAFGDAWLNTTNATPALDIRENEAAFVVQAALPGWKPEQVEIAFEKGVVTLKGELAQGETDDATDAPEQEPEKVRIHVHEIRRENFVRRFSLPIEVDADKATAEFENGLLTLTIPKAEIVKPKQIKIAVK